METVLVISSVLLIIAWIWATPEVSAGAPQLNCVTAFPSLSVVTVAGITCPKDEVSETSWFASGFVSASRTKMVSEEGVGEFLGSSKGNARINDVSADGLELPVARVLLPKLEFKKTKDKKRAKESKNIDSKPVSFLSILNYSNFFSEKYPPGHK
jgi:hypothetical protein